MKALAILLLAAPAFAETVEVVPTCAEAEDADARARLQRALELQDRLVVDIGCEDTVTVWHELDGDGVIVHMRNTLGARKLRVARDADMFETYARLARGLYEVPVEASPVATTTTYEIPNGTVVPMATSMWQVHGGFGVLGDNSASMILVGYRMGSNRTVLDISFRLMNSAESDRTATSFGAKVLTYTRPHAISSAYWGGGASLASVDYAMDSGKGFELDGTVGLEWNRDERWHYSLEGNVGFPFFTVGRDRYPASFALSFGIAH